MTPAVTLIAALLLQLSVSTLAAVQTDREPVGIGLGGGSPSGHNSIRHTDAFVVKTEREQVIGKIIVGVGSGGGGGGGGGEGGRIGRPVNNALILQAAAPRGPVINTVGGSGGSRSGSGSGGLYVETAAAEFTYGMYTVHSFINPL